MRIDWAAGRGWVSHWEMIRKRQERERESEGAKEEFDIVVELRYDFL